MRHRLSLALGILLPLTDLAWNLTHLNIGLSDFFGLTLPAYGLVKNGAWPATPYFPAGYPLLLIPFGLLGSTLIGGYMLSAASAMLALGGVRWLALVFGLTPALTVILVALAWLSPSFRVVAGSPSVDMAYTGLAIWFLWAAIALWRTGKGSP